MNDKGLKFPSYFPEGCPPDDASNEEIEVYRYCISNNEVTSDDFISYYQGNPSKYKNEILAYGLSVLLDYDECVKGLKTPALRKKFKGVAKGFTYKDMGVIKRTPNSRSKSHCTWWLYEGVKPESSFKIQTI